MQPTITTLLLSSACFLISNASERPPVLSSLILIELYLFEMNKKNEIKNKVESEKSDISWGNQIRSYVLDDCRIKDLRTKHETGNVQAVLDGDLDAFIEKSLKEGL